jgi:N-acyl-D-amino-acid deacylase
VDYDLLIKNGLVVDGTGAEPRRTSIGIRDGIITAVGELTGEAGSTVDAEGLLVTPGFIDIHTHYDGQAVWSSRINPSSSHGVTTIVTGNCGVGFAPCRPADRDLLVSMMEGVEDIPEAVMTEGLTWDWQSFPEYLNVLAAKPRDIDVACYIPHSAVRVFVMGERGAKREPATEADLERMAAIIREGMDAGAVGFASSRTATDRRSDGAYVPSFESAADELLAAARAVKDSGHGIMQIVPEGGRDGFPIEREFGLLRYLAETTGLQITFTLAQGAIAPDRWQQMLALTDDANDAIGADLLRPQYLPRPIGMIAGFNLTSHPFVHCPSYKAIAHLPLKQRIVELRKPGVRQRIVEETPDDATLPITALARNFAATYPLSDPPNYEPDPEHSIVAQALRKGMSPEEIAYDLMLEDDGQAMLYVAVGNYCYGSLDFLLEFFKRSSTIMGLGDGGAHYGLICDSSYPTFVLSHWVHGRSGERLPLAKAVRAMTAEPAELIGMSDRGLIAVGYKADVNVIDLERLRLLTPELKADLPAGGRRLDQRARGYRWTFVSGVPIIIDDVPTDNLPGRLVRGSATHQPQLA